MADRSEDTWTAWLDDQRFSGGDQEARLKQTLFEYRKTVLDNADLQRGATVLDVGAGDGLIAFGAANRVGADGTVVLADISRPVLAKARGVAAETGVDDRCEHIVAAAEELGAIEDGSIDAVTLRSVLIFVEDKERAFSEFERVLRPGGRLSIYEPIGEFDREVIERTDDLDDTFLRYDLTRTDHVIPEEARALYRRLREYAREHRPDHRSTIAFDERDLFVLAENAGFEHVHLTLHAYHTRLQETEDWDAWLATSFGPGGQTKQEAMDAVLSSEEQDVFEAHVRPLIESRAPKVVRGTPAYLWATKPG